MTNSSKFIVLGVGIAYLIIAFMFFIGKIKLPVWLYVEVAFTSLSITVLESFKVIAWKVMKIRRQIVKILAEVDKNECDRSEKRMRKTSIQIKIVSAIETILITVMVVTTPLGEYKNNAFTHKWITFISILAFAFLFLSMFINEMAFDESLDKKVENYLKKRDFDKRMEGRTMNEE